MLMFEICQLFRPSVPKESKVTFGATVSNQNDFEAETVCPALSRARTSTLCLPSGRLSTPEAGKLIQLLLSRLYSKEESPEPGMGSDAVALNIAAVYQELEPSVPFRLELRTGFCVSMEAFCEMLRVLPALSRAVNTRLCMPSLLTVIVLQDGSATPSRVHLKLAKPEVASVAEPLNEAGETYQLFAPDMPVKAPVMLGI